MKTKATKQALTRRIKKLETKAELTEADKIAAQAHDAINHLSEVRKLALDGFELPEPLLRKAYLAITGIVVATAYMRNLVRAMKKGIKAKGDIMRLLKVLKGRLK
jgi:hypothetical protein